MLRRLIIAAAALCAASAGSAFAEENVAHPHNYAFSFDGPLGSYDMAAVQRGFAVYKQVCAACHSMDHLAYRHLGEEGGPFAAYRVRNHETGEYEVVIGSQGHGGQLLDIADNPFVRAIADDVVINDIDRDSGQPIERPGRPSDRFRAPFPNEAAARASNGGAYPPDLSVITSARHGGADYIQSLLTGYSGEYQGTQYANPYFPGGLISMPPPLIEEMVVYDDGTPATVEQMSHDVTTFLQWAADPHMVARKKTGFMALAFLLVLAGLLYLSYKEVWRGQSH